MGLGHSWATPTQTSAGTFLENLKGVEDTKVGSVSSATSCRIEIRRDQRVIEKMLGKGKGKL